MNYVSEQTVIDTVTQEMITTAVSDVFVSLAKDDAVNFPIVRETLGYANAIFGFKSGFQKSDPLLGIKAGGLWPGNVERGLANHQSTIVLFDPETGSPHALVKGTYLTALRTAAASALSIRYLARQDSQTLGILGAGGQATFQIQAALKERNFEQVLIANRSRERTNKLVAFVEQLGLKARYVSEQEMAQTSDVIITITPSFEPILKRSWVRPGTHLACMGADTVGKNELDAEIISAASLFGDEPSQTVFLGEFQHAFRQGLIAQDDIVRLGQVIGQGTYARNADEITVFDSTGMGLQDLAAAQIALKAAQENDLALSLDQVSNRGPATPQLELA